MLSSRMPIAPFKLVPFRASSTEPNSPRKQRQRRRLKVWWMVAIGLPLLGLVYGGLKLKPFLKLFTEEIPVSVLARFANGEPLSGALDAYSQIPQVEALRPFLLAPVYSGPGSVPALVNSPEGEILLNRLSRILQTHDRQNNLEALQTALTKAALQEDLSLINVLRQFPEAKIRINGQEVWQTGWAIARAIRQNRTAVKQLHHQFTQQQTGIQLQPQSILLQASEPVDWFTVMLEDKARQRTLLLDIYQPLTPPEEATPVILISHGLTASRRTFSYLARYLASQGFFVVAVEHPDSNGAAHRRFLRGESATLFPPQTLIDRPLDIHHVLNRLEEANLNHWLDLNNVGIIGHSLGGNTALAVAGAELDRQQLQERCDPSERGAAHRAPQSLNLSLIFAQCPLLDLPEAELQTRLQDDRIQSVIAISPVASELFDSSSLEQLDLPVLMVASEHDWITPAVDEQIQPFEKMTPRPVPMAVSRRAKHRVSSHKPVAPRYLALLQGGAHWTVMGGRRCLLTGPRMQPDPSLLEEFNLAALADPVQRNQIHQLRQREARAIARDYLCGFSTAFFKTHLEGKPLADYLSADYAATLSQPQLPLIWVDSLTR